jgi:GTP cyclohydrolase FolE2
MKESCKITINLNADLPGKDQGRDFSKAMERLQAMASEMSRSKLRELRMIGRLLQKRVDEVKKSSPETT